MRRREFITLLGGAGLSLAANVRRARAQQPTRPVLLLRPRRERPRRRAANQRDELPPPHSITSSARASSMEGSSSPSFFAVFRFAIS